MLKIGRYEVEKEIGRGAMGVVYLARDPRLRRRVAVKTYSLPQGIPAEQTSEFRERFLREAQAAAALSHPGIVTVYDADEDPHQNLPFIAMEYIPGASLREVLQAEGRLPPARALAMADVLADALHVAHEAGIIHRDIKPPNILIRKPDGAAKIADFGVARLMTSELTQSGSSLGSPAYMSPEQVQGRSVDQRSDLFALAVILYECLCGERPFAGKDLVSLAHSIVYDTPIPITKRAEGLSPGLDGFFARALAKAPEDRFPSATAFREALREACRATTPSSAEATMITDKLAVSGGSYQDVIESLRTLTREVVPLLRWLVGQESTPRRRKMAGAALVLSLSLGGWAIWGGTAYVKLEVRNTVEAGILTLKADGRQVYARELAAPPQRRDFLGKVLPKNQEMFEAWIKLSPGKHELVASVLPQGSTSPYQDTIVVELERGEKRALRLSAGRSFGSPVSLRMK